MDNSFYIRWWRWVKRFRYRCGYNVHSPTDFFLITSVIYEKTPYYAYKTLRKQHFSKQLPHYRTKVNRLLFRLVNYFQPKNMIEAGQGNGEAQTYMKSASQRMKFLTVADGLSLSACKQQFEQYLSSEKEIEAVHLGHTPYYKELFEMALPYVTPKTCIIIGNLYESKQKEQWWEQLKKDERTGITFDLYDIGLVFFDKKRYKQHYTVNFL